MAAVLAAGLIAASPVAAAQAQEANQVTGLTVAQADGFATLAWQPVAGAAEYEIERTPVAADGTRPGPLRPWACGGPTAL